LRWYFWCGIKSHRAIWRRIDANLVHYINALRLVTIPPDPEIGFQPAFDPRGLDIGWLATRVGETSSVEIKYWLHAGWMVGDARQAGI
jgi:hypothetical protein